MPLPAWAVSTGIISRSGKQNGAMCTQCHGALGQVQLSVTIENANGTPAQQPLSPMTTYTLKVTAQRAGGSFVGGFNLATGMTSSQRTQGVLVTLPADTGVKVTNGEATHTARRSSTAGGAGQIMEWRVGWKPPVYATGSPNAGSRIYAATRSVAAGIRGLSAVSGGALAGAQECTSTNGAACGVAVAVQPINCVDADGDGFVSMACAITDPAQNGGDCNDGNGAIFPGSPERCNGLDDNCDGTADEGLPLADYYPDRDVDGYGDKNATAVRTCGAIRADQLGVSNATQDRNDCNDSNNAINPSRMEVCDGLDNNCNGRVDEGYTWNGVGVGQICMNSSAPSACQRGVVRCVNMSPQCVITAPATERCDPWGMDEDCDGLTDEQEFPQLVQQTCMNTAGCQSVYTCNPDGTSVSCVEFAARVRDVCNNGLDDDCDGEVDETSDIVWNGLAFGTPCDSLADPDQCTSGRVNCQDGRAACVGDMPTPELCNNALDDDCDGQMDEPDCTGGNPASSSSSAASSTVTTASAGASSAAVQPSSEVPATSAAAPTSASSSSAEASSARPTSAGVSSSTGGVIIPTSNSGVVPRPDAGEEPGGVFTGDVLCACDTATPRGGMFSALLLLWFVRVSRRRP